MRLVTFNAKLTSIWNNKLLSNSSLRRNQRFLTCNRHAIDTSMCLVSRKNSQFAVTDLKIDSLLFIYPISYLELRLT
jgi:hypothetical protein